MEDHALDIIICKQLFGQGMVIPARFFWITEVDGCEGIYTEDEVADANHTYAECVPAPMVSELWNKLPGSIDIYTKDFLDTYELEIKKNTDYSASIIYRHTFSKPSVLIEIREDSLVNASGKMLLWLKAYDKIK